MIEYMYVRDVNSENVLVFEWFYLQEITIIILDAKEKEKN